MSIISIDIATGRRSEPYYTAIGGAIANITVSPDGRHFLAQDGSGNVWLRETNMTTNPFRFKTGAPAQWLPDSRRLLGGVNYDSGLRGYDTKLKSQIGVLLPHLGNDQYACIGPDGHYRGSEKIDEHLVYVAQHEDGSMKTYTPAEFAKTFGWQNDPKKARLLALDP